MLSTCGGMSFGGAVGDKVTPLPGRFSCNSAQTSSPAVTVAQSAVYAEAPVLVNADASGQTVMGQTKLFAHFRGSHETTGFGAAAATGGWVDMLTLHPLNGGQIGQLATFSFKMMPRGALAGQGVADSWNSSARFGVKPYINDAGFAPGPKSEFSVQGQGQQGFRYNQTINQLVTFTTQVTLGAPFELGVFARALVGVASTGPVAVLSEATVDFSNSVTGGGISALTLNGNAVPYTLASASGIDWTQAYSAPVPEPAGAWLRAAGLGLLGVRRWSSRAALLR